jgi:hypothetical protein
MSALAARSHPYPRALYLAPWLILASLLVALPGGLAAQPFGQYLGFNGGTGAVTVPDSPGLNPSGALTVELWVNLSSYSSDYTDLAGKGWTHSWALFVSSTGTLRSYLRGYQGGVPGTGQVRDGGFVPLHEWTHIALVFDGVNRYHYIDGELVATFPEPGGLLPASPQPLELGSDPDYHGRSLHGFLDEVRLWNVARSQAQIRSTLQGFMGGATGLVAFWPLNGNESDILAGHNGTLAGTPLPVFPLPPPVILFCSPSPTTLCLGGRFIVSARFRNGPQSTPEMAATPAACSNPGSGLFWFFSPDNWEVMVKTIDACALNSRFWVFSAATTNVFYRMEVYDVRSGVNRIYFNYSGPPAPAVTDTSAFATCP